MIEVTVNGVTYQCEKAVKGPNFIKLFDSGGMFTSFDGISDFSDYNISGGDWSAPEPTAEEKLERQQQDLAQISADLQGFMDFYFSMNP